MKIEISSASDAFDILQNLYALYIHDMSEFVDLDVAADGRFALPPNLAAYWLGPDTAHHRPFLIRADGEIAGFALVREIRPATYDMAQFFVLRKYRREGIGRQAACTLFDRFAGNWEVREIPSNLPALAFWRRVIADYTEGQFTESRDFFPAYRGEYVVQRFIAPHGDPNASLA